MAYPGSVNVAAPALGNPIPITLTNKMRVPPKVVLYSVKTGAAGYWWNHSAQADVKVNAADIGESGFRIYCTIGCPAGNILVGHWTADSSE